MGSVPASSSDQTVKGAVSPRTKASLVAGCQQPCCPVLANRGLLLRQAPDRGLIAPDVVLFLAMDPAAAASREGFGEERYEKLAFQQQVCCGFVLGATYVDDPSARSFVPPPLNEQDKHVVYSVRDRCCSSFRLCATAAGASLTRPRPWRRSRSR